MALIPRAYDRVDWRGVTLSRRTAAALNEVEKEFRRRAGKKGLTLAPAQGSYNKGGVAASGGTHDLGGAIDLRIGAYTETDRKILVRCLKDGGFAAWFRASVPGVWGAHVHALDLGANDLSGGARAQVLSYDAGRDGLRGNRVDDTYRASPRVRYSFPLRRVVRR